MRDVFPCGLIAIGVDHRLVGLFGKAGVHCRDGFRLRERAAVLEAVVRNPQTKRACTGVKKSWRLVTSGGGRFLFISRSAVVFLKVYDQRFVFAGCRPSLLADTSRLASSFRAPGRSLGGTLFGRTGLSERALATASVVVSNGFSKSSEHR